VNAVVVPADPIGPMAQAWRECVGTGRVDRAHRVQRHEVTLVELEPVRVETPPWLDDSRIPGYGR